MTYPNLSPGDLILYKCPTDNYTLQNGWDEEKELTVIGQTDELYLYKEYLPGKFLGIHKSRFIRVLKNCPGKQLEIQF